MRRTIETAPRDENAIILEDDASGTYDVAHWSPEAGEWVGENGEPSKITPSHWHPLPGENYFQQGQDISSSTSLAGRSASRARRYSLFPFSSSRAPPQRSEASDVMASRSGAMAAPATVEAFEAQTAPVEAKRAPLARWRFAASSIAATLVAASLISTYLRAEIAAYVTPHSDQQDIFKVSTIGGQVVEQKTQLPSQDSRKTDSLALQQQANADQPSAQPGAQVKQALASAPEARQSLEKEQRIEVLANELAEARRAINGLSLQLRAAAADSAQLLGRERRDAAAARQQLAASRLQLEEERARSAALASQFAVARHEIETQAAQSGKTGAEAAQFKQATESQMAELRQSLRQEHARAEALASELATAQRDVETQAALSRKAGGEAAQFKQAAESTAELRQSLQQERGRTGAMARDTESMPRTIDGRVAVEPAASSQTAQVTQAAEAAVMEQPAAAEAQGSPEATRLIARASALLGQGNIGAARIVLERAAETGSAQASFMLAETYDPFILSAWGTYGTRGEATKAREFYAKARAGGIQEAKDRFDALSQ